MWTQRGDRDRSQHATHTRGTDTDLKWISSEAKWKHSCAWPLYRVKQSEHEVQRELFFCFLVALTDSVRRSRQQRAILERGPFSAPRQPFQAPRWFISPEPKFEIMRRAGKTDSGTARPFHVCDLLLADRKQIWWPGWCAFFLFFFPPVSYLSCWWHRMPLPPPGAGAHWVSRDKKWAHDAHKAAWKTSAALGAWLQKAPLTSHFIWLNPRVIDLHWFNLHSLCTLYSLM